MGDSEAVGCAIEKMLNVNRTLKTLNLNDCRLDTAVITHIAAGLAHNASLGELNIEGDIFSINDITSEGWVHLFKALCNNSLKKLDISSNKLGMEGSVALAEMYILAVTGTLQMWSWVSGGVYKNWFLDALGGSFVLNLTTLGVATYHVKISGGNQLTVGYASVSIALTFWHWDLCLSVGKCDWHC